MNRRQWKKVEGYESRFEISEDGKIRSLPRRNILKPWIDADGYEMIVSCANGQRVKLRPHRVVAEMFLTPVSGKEIVNHVDGNKRNNHYSNLEWCTVRENSAHAVAHQLLKPSKGSSHYSTHLTEADVRHIRREYIPWINSYRKLAKKYDVHWSTIREIIKGRNWKDVIVAPAMKHAA